MIVMSKRKFLNTHYTHLFLLKKNCDELDLKLNHTALSNVS